MGVILRRRDGRGPILRERVVVACRRARGLARFVRAQESRSVYGVAMIDRAMTELRQGWKRGHWMWYVFPQARGLGRSVNSRVYALTPREAQAYLWHPVLGLRLMECVQIVMDLNLAGARCETVLGPVDTMKYRSCLELFAGLPRTNSIFRAAMEVERQSRETYDRWVKVRENEERT